MAAIPTNAHTHHVSKPGYSKLKACGILFVRSFSFKYLEGLSKKLFNFQKKKKKTTNPTLPTVPAGSKIILIVTAETNWHLPSTDHLYLVQSEYYNSAGSANEAVAGTLPVHC